MPKNPKIKYKEISQIGKFIVYRPKTIDDFE